jgi:nucleoside-diphosphate-sugar epimerase
MRVLITGATGFLGGVLLRHLRAKSWGVVAQGRDRVKLAELVDLGCKALPLDLALATGEQLATSARDVGLCDAVVHCAALSSPWGRYRDFEAANVTGTENALTLAGLVNAQRFVQISTPAVYFKLADQVAIGEDTILPEPINAYAQTKRMAEGLVLAHNRLDPLILRPRGIYGAGDTALLPRLLKAASTRPLPLMRGGAAATDLTHVEDVVSAIVAALAASTKPSQRIFNVSGGQALKVRDVAEAAGAMAGIKVRWRALPVGLVMAGVRASESIFARLPGMPEPPITAYAAGLFAYTQTLDISAAERVLGWRPQIDFAQGLAKTFAR